MESMETPPPPPTPSNQRAVNDAERRASGECWAQTLGSLTRQQTLNTSLLIQFHLYLQTTWQFLLTEVVTFHYGSFLPLPAAFYSPATSDIPTAAAQSGRRKGLYLLAKMACHLTE